MRRTLLLIPAFVAVAASTLGAAGRAPLVDAVRNGDATALRALIKSGGVNVPEPDGTTALHWAARIDDAAAVNMLLEAGANARVANRYGVTPLWLACINGNAAIIERLLKAGADANTAMPEGDTALMTAARSGSAAAARALLSRGANVNASEKMKGQTALMWAAADGRVDVIRALVEGGAAVQTRSTGEGGFMALHFAVREGSVDGARALLDAGAKVNDALTDGTSPLALSAANANYDVGVLLLERGADPNVDTPGWTALHRVTWLRRPYRGTNNPFPVPNGSVDSIAFVQKLLAAGAKPNPRLRKSPEAKYVGRDMSVDKGAHVAGATPFFLAARNDDVPLMRALLAGGANPLEPNDEGTTPLMAAAGVSIRAKGENPGTPEEAAEAVQFCLGLGGDVTTVDKNGDTALHGAAMRGSNAAIRLLVDKGAKLDVRNNVGWTPWRVAQGVVYNITVMRSPETAVFLRELMEARGMKISESEPDIDEHTAGSVF